MDDDPAEEDDDFEVDLEAVDFVSFALAVVSLAFKALEFESIPAAMVQRFRAIVGTKKNFGENRGQVSSTMFFAPSQNFPSFSISITLLAT